MSVIYDLRFALRTLRRRPGFTAVAVLTLALGIGANAAMFSVVDGVLLRPLPYPEPERLERLFLQIPEARLPLSLADFELLEERQRSFASFAAYRSARLTLTEAGSGVTVTWVKGRLFETLGAEPVLGRTFSDGDDWRGGERVAVASYRFWERQLGADPGAVDRYVRLDGRPYRVVGVMAQSFRPPGDAELWLAEPWSSGPWRGPFVYDLVARRAAGVDEGPMRAELGALSEEALDRWPGTFPDRNARYVGVPLRRELLGAVETTLYVLLVAVAFVLLMATSNVAHLLLAKASTRRREMALRATLGASRGRLARLLLAESVVLAVLGGLAGLLMASWGLDLLLSWSPHDLPRLDEVRLDGRVLAFTAVVTLLTGALCGVAPLRNGLTVRLSERLQGEGTTPTASDRRLRGLLVAAELAVALPLLVAAGLMIRSFFELRHVDPGFDPTGTLTVQVSLPEVGYPEPETVRAFYDELGRRLRSLPDVRSLGLTTGLPPNDLWGRHLLHVEGRDATADVRSVVGRVTASAGFFETLGIPLRRGRLFDDSDRAEGLPVALVDETLARRFFRDRDPIGRRLRIGGCEFCPWLTVVGVVGSVKYGGLHAPDEPVVYVPQSQQTSRTAVLTVRTGQDPWSLLPYVRRTVGGLDSGLLLSEARTLESVVAESMAGPRYRMSILGAFATVALALAAIGIYGVLSYSVSQSRRDIGIRMALGAEAGRVRRHVLREGLAHVGWGVAAGVLATVALTRFLASLVYGVSVTEPATVASVTAVLVAVAATACFLPAHRATRIDPIRVLREE